MALADFVMKHVIRQLLAFRREQAAAEDAAALAPYSEQPTSSPPALRRGVA